jgi:hypothetical protein
MPWHARASLQTEPRAHGRRTSRNTGPRAAARPEPLAVPSTLGAPETGRALRGSPQSPRAFRRGSSNDLPRNGPRKLTGARTLQARNRVRFRREQPCNSANLFSASPHALLHVWSPKARLTRKEKTLSTVCCGMRARADRSGVCVCVCVCVCARARGARVCCVACRACTADTTHSDPSRRLSAHTRPTKHWVTRRSRFWHTPRTAPHGDRSFIYCQYFPRSGEACLR